MKVTDIAPELRKRPLVRFVYWLCTRIELYADYRSGCPAESLRYRALTRIWMSLEKMSIWLYRRSRRKNGNV